MKLHDKTNAELIALRTKIEEDPANQERPESLWKLIPKARKKVDNINWQIAHNLAEARAKAGGHVISDGYSGRKCNKRR